MQTPVIHFLKDNKWALIGIAVFFWLHLFKLTAPPLDTHSWRQVDTVAVVRNFGGESPNILFPRVDIRREFSGITGMEFPLYNYAIFMWNKAFGFHHWIGRLVSLESAVAGLFFFYLLIKDRYTKRLALFALFAMITSTLWFYFSRNIQPDVMMVALSIASLYFANRFAITKKFYQLVLFFVLLSAAMLVKLPAVFIGLPAAYILLFEHRNLLKLKDYVLGAAIVVLPNVAWYLWSQHLSSHYGLGNYFYEGLNLPDSLHTLLTTSFWKHVFILRTFSSVSTVIGGVLALVGIGVAVKKRDWFALTWLGAILAFALLFSTKTYFHTYYSLPRVAPVAVLTALGLNFIVQKVNFKQAAALIVLVFLLMVAQVAVEVRPLYAIKHSEYLKLEPVVVRYINPSKKIIVNGGVSPEMLYFSHRKGWTATNSEITNDYLADKTHKGADFVVIDKLAPGVLPFDPKNPVIENKVYEDDMFIIYSLF